MAGVGQFEAQVQLILLFWILNLKAVTFGEICSLIFLGLREKQNKNDLKIDQPMKLWRCW